MNPFLDFLESFAVGWKRKRYPPKRPEDTTDVGNERARIAEWVVPEPGSPPEPPKPEE